MSEPIYCGHAKVITTQYGSFTKVVFRESDLTALQENLNSDGFVAALIKPKRDQNKKMPYYLEIDNRQPDASNNNNRTAPNNNNSADDEPLPF